MHRSCVYLCSTEYILFSAFSIFTSLTHHLLTALTHRQISISRAFPNKSVHFLDFQVKLYFKHEHRLPVVAQDCALLFPVQHLLRWNPTLFFFSSFIVYKNSFNLSLKLLLTKGSHNEKMWEEKRNGKWISSAYAFKLIIWSSLPHRKLPRLPIFPVCVWHLK